MSLQTYLSILLMNDIRGTLYRRICLSTVVVWLYEPNKQWVWNIITGLLACTPATAQRTRMAPSNTRRARSTSIVKSTWPTELIRNLTTETVQRALPGVSIIFIAYFCLSPVTAAFASQSQNVAALWIVIPFSRSSSILSILAPTPSRPRTSWIAPTRPV